jgi:pyruvate dehydrogenase complex dehydrogenase (E1) component
MNLKDCEFASMPLVPARALLDPSFEFEAAELPAGAVPRFLVYDSPTSVLLAYTVSAQGLPQADINRLVSTAVRKGMYLTEREAVEGLTEHALHQYGAPRLALLSEDQYREMATWLRNVEVVVGGGSTPPTAAL